MRLFAGNYSATHISASGTVNAASPSEADVASAISSANVGDTVVVPAGSGTWNTLNIAKAVTLQGAGVGSTNITLGSGNGITKQSGGVIRIKGFSFSKTSGGNESHAFGIGGSWTGAEPIIIEGNAFTISASALFQISTPGGIIIANNDFTGDWDDSFIRPKDDSDTYGSWTTAHTMGTADTDGKLNIYVEDNTFYGGTNQGIDADDASRVVYRYNDLTFSSFNTHGWDTSPVGVRHFEVYNNVWHHDGSSSAIANQNWLIWIRGGTGTIFNNTFVNISGGFWGDKPELHFSIRGAEDQRPQGACANVSYPVPRQLGQNHNGTSYFTDPIYIYSNTGTQEISAGWNWGNPCGFNFDDFWQLDRDYKLSARPSYTTYTYPHPLRSA